MKLIRVTEDMEISVHDYPAGEYSEWNKAITSLIGEKCTTVEHVMPRRLYSEFEHKDRAEFGKPGKAVGMLIDEEGFYHDLKPNPLGSYLYETDIHRNPIVGTILFVGEELGEDGLDFCGLDEDVFNVLLTQIRNWNCAWERTCAKEWKEAVK